MGLNYKIHCLHGGFFVIEKESVNLSRQIRTRNHSHKLSAATLRLGIKALRIGGRNVFQSARSRLESASEETEGKNAENHAAARVERKTMGYAPRLVLGTPKALRSTYRGVKSAVNFTAKQAQTFKRKQALRQRIKRRASVRTNAGRSSIHQRQKATLGRYLKQSRRILSSKSSAGRIRSHIFSIAARNIKKGSKLTLRKGRSAVTARAAQAVRTKQKEAEKRNAENYASSRAERAIMKVAPKVAKISRKTVKLGGRALWAIPKTARRIYLKRARNHTQLGKERRASVFSQRTDKRRAASTPTLSKAQEQGFFAFQPDKKPFSQGQASAAPTSTRAKPQTAAAQNTGRARKIRSKTGQNTFRSSSIRGKEHSFKTRTAGQTVNATPQKDVIATRRKDAAIKKAKQKASGQVSSRAVQQAKVLAMRAAKRSAQLVKDLVKAVATAVKALIAAIGGGALFIALIALIAGAAFIFASPWGIFFGTDDPNSHPIPQVVAEIEAEFSGQMQASTGGSFDVEYESEGDSLVSNWIDVLGVFAVKTSTNMQNPLDVGTMDDEKKAILKQVFMDMNQISSTQETITETADDGTQTTKTVSKVSVESKTWEEMIPIYGFNAEQEKLLRELMEGEYYDLFVEILGMAPGAVSRPLTQEEWDAIAQDLPPGSHTSKIVKKAFERLGDPYSQSKRGQGRYVDCSYFTRWVYRAFGLEIPGVAADQAEWCVDNGLVVSYNDLQPGDLVFFASGSNGRYMNVDHTGIYVGNGKIIDASSSRGKVVYRDLWTSTLVLCGRPSLKL